MRKILFVTLIFGLSIFTSCSEHIYISYQTESANTGKVVLKPSGSTSGTYLTINDKLIVDDKNVKSITVSNVPDGDYNFHYTSQNNWYKYKLDTKIPVKMEMGKEVTKLVEVPPYSTGYWFYVTGMAILPWFIFAL